MSVIGVRRSSSIAAVADLGGGQLCAQSVGIALGEPKAAFEAVRDISLKADSGEFVCLLGPSGCGKSTLLSAFAGHVRTTRGVLTLDSAVIDGPDPQLGLVFQHHTLFPWKTVLGNVAHGLKMRGIDRPTRERVAREMIATVGLAGFETRYPRELSGGMQQRIEIARALVNKPRVLLMDEPFAALDALTRARMQELLLQLWKRTRVTVLFVTHDIEEALYLADRVVILSRAPATVLEEIVLPAARPRHEGQLADACLLDMKRHCLSLLRPNEAEAAPIYAIPSASTEPSPQLAMRARA